MKPGRYRHFKGGLYVVTGTALHTESEETLVIYHSQDETGRWYARPRTMFGDQVFFGGELKLRFTYEGPVTDEAD